MRGSTVYAIRTGCKLMKPCAAAEYVGTARALVAAGWRIVTAREFGAGECTTCDVLEGEEKKVEKSFSDPLTTGN